jgi:SAM-dependent methyltransferase
MTGSAPSCPVCQTSGVRFFARARDVEYYSSDRLFTYLACDSCGSVYLDSPPIDKLPEIYPANYYSYRPRAGSRSFVEKAKECLDARLFKNLLSQITGEKINILDVGGGSGWLLTLIRKLSQRIDQTHEVDVEEGARSAAEAAGHIFHSCRIEDFVFSGTFDLILMLNLIEHVADPERVLRSMSKLLSPGGLILIKTPNVDTLDCRIFRHHNWGGFHCPRHFVIFNQESLLNLARRCGLTELRVSYTQGAPQWACSILGWLGINGWINVSRERPLYIHPLYPIVCAFCAAFDFIRAPFMRTAQMFVVFRRETAPREG